MPHPYVTRVTLTDSQIVLTIQLDLFPSGESLEISGFASQNSGGFATFYDIQPVVKNPDGTVTMYVRATPGQKFKNGEPVTVSLRAAIVWITVVTPSQDGESPGQTGSASDGVTDASESASESTTAQEDTVWNTVSAVGWVSGGPLPSWGAGQTSVGSDSNFPPA